MNEDVENLLDVEWKVKLPALWYAALPSAFAVMLAVIYGIFRSLSVLYLLGAVLSAFAVIFMLFTYLLHPLHFGKRQYTRGQLLLSQGYFGIKQNKGRHFFFFDNAKSRISTLPEGSVIVTDLHAVLVQRGIPIGEVSWSWWRTSILIRFRTAGDTEHFMKATKSPTPMS